MIVRVDVRGDREAARTILNSGLRAADARVQLEMIANDYARMVEEHFDSEGRSSGQPWKPLSMSRVAQKARKGLDPRIMHATLDLRKSLTKRGAKGSIRTVRSTELIMGTRIPYAGYHDKPGSGSRLPRRKLVVVKRMRRRAWARSLERYIATGQPSPIVMF